MTILKSVFLGYSGNYKVADIPVSFYRKSEDMNDFIDNLSQAIRRLNESKGVFDNSPPQEKIDPKTISLNSTVALLSQQYFFTFVHEMGHAIAIKILNKNEKPTIDVYLEEHDGSLFNFQDKILGGTTHKESSDWKGSVILAAGPLTECVIAGAQCVAATALSHYLPSKIAQSLYFVSSIALFTKSLNSIYCFGGQTDFSRIKNISYKHLAVATTLIAGNIFAVIAINRQFNPPFNPF